ncbi:hypothetical protein ACFOYU_15165, partial [Microvirga sp. GCM10011540]|uniref:hypothetical protein n=1 Tax=Microvirga sp. GCM10011540 TaxID=3317338 RepID=UPI00361471EC
GAISGTSSNQDLDQESTGPEGRRDQGQRQVCGKVCENLKALSEDGRAKDHKRPGIGRQDGHEGAGPDRSEIRQGS